MNRRGFLSTMLAAHAAPAICKAEWMMKGRVLVRPGFTMTEMVLPNVYPELPLRTRPLVEGEYITYEQVRRFQELLLPMPDDYTIILQPGETFTWP